MRRSSFWQGTNWSAAAGHFLDLLMLKATVAVLRLIVGRIYPSILLGAEFEGFQRMIPVAEISPYCRCTGMSCCYMDAAEQRDIWR